VFSSPVTGEEKTEANEADVSGELRNKLYLCVSLHQAAVLARQEHAYAEACAVTIDLQSDDRNKVE
jgi:hypothetical protein